MNYTQSEEYLFNTMPVGRAIASLAVPTVISQIITVIYNMADTFFVGQLGDPNQVAAATVALPLFIFITALANLFGVGGASLISRCLGQGDRQKAGHTAAFWRSPCPKQREIRATAKKPDIPPLSASGAPLRSPLSMA